MSLGELFMVAVALAADAFAVSVCKGLASSAGYVKTGVVCGAWFGAFQALMPFIGWILGKSISKYTEGFSAYIAFALLAFLGVKMIAEAISEKREASVSLSEGRVFYSEKNSSLSVGIMLLLSIATGVDALAAGFSLSAVGVNVYFATVFIGTVTFILSFVGAAAGARLGKKAGIKAQLAGGAVLIALGLKLLAEYLLGRC